MLRCRQSSWIRRVLEVLEVLPACDANAMHSIWAFSTFSKEMNLQSAWICIQRSIHVYHVSSWRTTVTRSTYINIINIYCHYLPMPPMPEVSLGLNFCRQQRQLAQWAPKATIHMCPVENVETRLVHLPWWSRDGLWRAVARCKRQLHAGKLSCLWHSAQDEQLGLAWPTFFFTMEEIERDWKRLKEKGCEANKVNKINSVNSVEPRILEVQWVWVQCTARHSPWSFGLSA